MNLSLQGPFSRENLSPEECRERLGRALLARVVISIRCLPAARPVRIALWPEAVVLATDETAVHQAAQRGDVLTVQIDGLDGDGATWMVQATGMSWVVDPKDAARRLDDGDDLWRALDDGATLVGVPLTVLDGDRTKWSFPRARA